MKLTLRLHRSLLGRAKGRLTYQTGPEYNHALEHESRELLFPGHHKEFVTGHMRDPSIIHRQRNATCLSEET